MKIKFMGKYNNDPKSLPKGEMISGAHRIKKIDNLAVLTLVMTLISCVLGYLFLILLVNTFGRELLSIAGVVAAMLAFVFMIPHEYIHAVCFKEESYIYVGNGLLFAMSPEHMSKKRYLFMLMLPFLLLGALPLVAGLIFHWSPPAIFGALSIITCTGDLYFAANALVQVPSRGKIYLYDMVNFWYVD
ncbi:metalloprotease family protein [Ruminococcus flavefaciens]|uniref:metalloprotease family protein n=1 Tax=Ruminococcus flavefaciens TaxID=1265 RepID=UPI000492134A|nr:metalloprotease family protein [Ruminococcus flavefaciens]